MADTDILIKDLPLTETVNDSDDLVTEDSSPTTHRIKASVVKNYINAEQNEELDGLRVDLDNVNSNIGSLSSKVDDATTTVSSMQTQIAEKANGTGDVGSGTKPVYLSAGAVTASSSTVGSGTKPVYLSSGTVTASSSTVGSGTKPVYLSSGTVTASSSTVGSSSNPVYLNSGTITACNMSSVFRVAVVSTDNVTISASSNYSYSVSASLSGYTPQAVIGYSISNASSSGTMSSWCNVFGYWLADNTAYANIRNTSTSTDAKVQIQLWILYGAS